MKVQINKEEMKREWVITKWYEKTIYVVGYILMVFYALCAIVGVIIGIIEM